MVWQFVRARADAQYARGGAKVTVTVARRTMAPEWRIEDLSIDRLAGRSRVVAPQQHPKGRAPRLPGFLESP
jgi:hypothetical protein